MYLTLSWRNIWRSKRRTLIVVASIFFALILAIVMRSGQLGSYNFMIHSSAKLFTGYVQVQGKGFWDNRSLDKSMVMDPEKLKQLEQIDHLSSYTPRLEGFSLVSFQKNTRVSQIIGVSPESENEMTEIKKRLSRGKFLEENDPGILLGEGLARLLEVSLGDSIVLYGQGFQGQTAAAMLPVKGLVKLPFSQMNNGMVFMSLQKAQHFFLAENRITSLPIMVEKIKYLDNVKKQVQEIFPEHDIKTWDEMMPELKQNIQVDNASGLIMIGILYVVIAFGVFGTVMMMVSERKREFGILVSVGMHKAKLMIVTIFESVFISILGVISGIIGSIPFIYYLYSHPIRLSGGAAEAYDKLGIEPIMAFSNSPSIFWGQALVVFVIALITILYPVLFIRKLEPVESFRR